MTREQHLKAMHILVSYDSDNQMFKCVEELSELSTAIMQYINKGKDSPVAVFEEIVDVEIMLEQIKALLPYGDNVYENEIDRKLDRQIKRIKGEENEQMDNQTE